MIMRSQDIETIVYWARDGDDDDDVGVVFVIAVIDGILVSVLFFVLVSVC